MSDDVKSQLENADVQDFLRIIESLMQRNRELEQENKILKDKIAQLQKDSTNSSKPPSSDGLKKKRGSPGRGKSGRKPGGQKGHPGKARAKIPRDKVSKIVEHKPEKCEICSAVLTEDNQTIEVESHQVWEIPKIEPLIEEHIYFKTTCKCGHQTRLPVEPGIASGTGENLQALIAYLTAVARLSRRTVQQLLDEIFNTLISLGAIQNRLEDTSQALAPVCNELEEALGNEPVINVDETGYPHNGKLAWLWVFATTGFAFFTLNAKRSSKVLKNVLGEAFDGIITCDRFSAYIKYQNDRANGLLQFCWAHIIRDVKALDHTLAVNCRRPFSLLMRMRIGTIFRLWHAFKNGKISRQELIKKSEPRILSMRVFLEENLDSQSAEVCKLCRGLIKKWDSLFTFIYHEGVEPTNNLAERMVRPGVQARKISFCTRSQNGQLLLARMLTASQTCRMQKRNPLQFLRQAISAKRHQLPFPSLLSPQIDI